jgi:hypothetical protein
VRLESPIRDASQDALRPESWARCQSLLTIEDRGDLSVPGHRETWAVGPLQLVVVADEVVEHEVVGVLSIDPPGEERPDRMPRMRESKSRSTAHT